MNNICSFQGHCVNAQIVKLNLFSLVFKKADILFYPEFLFLFLFSYQLVWTITFIWSFHLGSWYLPYGCITIRQP